MRKKREKEGEDEERGRRELGRGKEGDWTEGEEGERRRKER